MVTAPPALLHDANRCWRSIISAAGDPTVSIPSSARQGRQNPAPGPFGLATMPLSDRPVYRQHPTPAGAVITLVCPGFRTPRITAAAWDDVTRCPQPIDATPIARAAVATASTAVFRWEP